MTSYHGSTGDYLTAHERWCLETRAPRSLNGPTGHALICEAGCSTSVTRKARKSGNFQKTCFEAMIQDQMLEASLAKPSRVAEEKARTARVLEQKSARLAAQKQEYARLIRSGVAPAVAVKLAKGE